LGLDAPPRMDAGILEGLTPEQTEMIEVVADAFRDPPRGEDHIMDALTSLIKRVELSIRRGRQQAG
jgi:hypothetical protein